MITMAFLLGVIFIGITIVAHAFAIVPSQDNSGGPTVVALVAGTAFGSSSPLFVAFQLSTALILFLAANTSFNAFPRLAAILAEDGYMPASSRSGAIGWPIRGGSSCWPRSRSGCSACSTATPTP